MNSNEYEKYPGIDVEKKEELEVPPGQDFAKSFEEGVPEFVGEQTTEVQYGQASPENLYYGEAKDDKKEADAREEYDEGIADAAAIINYGLDAAARDLGVETVVQKIKGFDASGREDPIGDLFRELGINSSEESQAVKDESAAMVANETAFREGANNPGQRRSPEGAFRALADMKELISEVEGADPRYEELRAGAKSAGKGYFEYAVSKFGTQGLTELFSVLAQQREKADELKNETPKKIDEEETKMAEISEAEGVKNDELLGKEKRKETLNPEILEKQM